MRRKMAKHSPEPWQLNLDDGQAFIVDCKGYRITTTDPELTNPLSDEDAERMVACVNACRGIPTEFLQSRQIGLNQWDCLDLQHMIYLRIKAEREAEPANA
jgi:hypothetical protein